MADIERDTLRRVSRRLVPFLFLLYVACWIDRVNVGFAALQMNRALKLSDAAFGLGAGVFFLGYFLFEVPSNLVLARVGARRWIARIMISWGIISAAMVLTRGPASFYALRFLLGIAEAGFFPGIIYFLGGWFPCAARARIIARFMVAIPIAGVLGAPLSGALLGLDGRAGLAGWQWLFLIEAGPSIVLGFVTLRYLTDGPADASWLPSAQRQWLSSVMLREQAHCAERHRAGAWGAIRHPMVWKLALLEGLVIVSGTYALSFWLPQIIKAFSGSSDLWVGMVTTIPYLASAVAMVLVGAHSDRSGERLRHIALASFASAIGFMVAASGGSPGQTMVGLSIAMAGTLGAVGPFWALPGTFLTGAAAAAGIALVNSFANLMGFATPYAVGVLKLSTGGYAAGLVALGVIQAAGALFAWRLRGATELTLPIATAATPATPATA